ncbi:hypothetical protein LS73_006840 [Helicobacter muridarum]|uniref:ATP synthase subunit b n=1 Tax=Helicobacter muridarum TaxID=216 RepID=A0A099TY80_9HELI|nr:ATP synthase subunit B [Helicobacter muridarum]TLD99781.1 hypothetical protein LS73_006840 [Helicobacter muridarum]STQ86985.1 ATP synthase F0F1 subunit B [Helicobacter muridarum]
MRFIAILTLVGLSGILFASQGGHIDISKTDIFERLVNFIIFVVLLWYLVADKLKAILSARSIDIANRLSESQMRTKQAKSKKEKAKIELEDTKQKAKSIIETAKKEALISEKEIEEKAKEQILYITKSNEESMKFQAKAFQKQIIQEVLQEILSSNKIQLTSNDYINILEKKVS